MTRQGRDPPTRAAQAPAAAPRLRTRGFRSFMEQALDAARAAEELGEVPVGAVLVAPDGAVLATASNRTRTRADPTAHAEILAIRAAAARLGTERLEGCALYVTLEPCPMCAMAIAHARIARLYYGAADPKSGGVAHGPRIFSHPQCHHRPEVYDGIATEACSELLHAFFARLRQAKPGGDARRVRP